LLVGDVLAGRYELQELAGSGGMSTVFRAHDRELERTVALKILHQRYNDEDEYVERFRREARMAAALSHQHLVTVIDRGEHEGRQFIVFEYVDGDNLKEVIDRSGPQPVERALELGIQIASGLAFAHANGLVHRDVKPQNVLLNGDGNAKVTDFGIARSLDVGRGVTQTGTVLGTSDYIAPEQAQGQPVGERTDVYSLGVVLYELLTGELPFAGDNFVAVAMRHINEPAPHVSSRRPDVPPRLDAAIAKALAKDPAERFARMDDFGRELKACLAELRDGTESSDTVVLPPSGGRTGSRRRRIVAPAVLVLLGLALLASVAWLALDPLGSQNGGNSGGGTAVAGTVALQGVGIWDPPPGDGSEHAADAPKATDGDQATYWSTETYFSAPSLGKPGVGLVLDAGRTVELGGLTVSTDTPGFVATIQAGDSDTGPFHDVSSSQTVEGETAFDLADARGRYFVIWITSLPPGDESAHVNEVAAS
jgi:eukaryotic-like serine/threonine-protein kinase